MAEDHEFLHALLEHASDGIYFKDRVAFPPLQQI